jgi:hypothetical protein
MPRYFFNVLEGHSENLARDSEGVEFSSLNEAREEAVGLARDFAKHGFYRSMQAWELVVADENGHELLTVPLSDIGPRKIREGRGETAETRFVSIDGSTITAAELRKSTAQITVRFVSKLVSSTRDRNGTVIDGNADKVTDVTDVWTFARDVSSRDPNWKVVATEAGQ